MSSFEVAPGFGAGSSSFNPDHWRLDPRVPALRAFAWLRKPIAMKGEAAVTTVSRRYDCPIIVAVTKAFEQVLQVFLDLAGRYFELAGKIVDASRLAKEANVVTSVHGQTSWASSRGRSVQAGARGAWR